MSNVRFVNGTAIKLAPDRLYIGGMGSGKTVSGLCAMLGISYETYERLTEETIMAKRLNAGLTKAEETNEILDRIAHLEADIHRLNMETWTTLSQVDRDSRRPH